MSIRVMTAIWDLALPPSEKLVLLALADWSDDAGWSHPSIAKVAKKTGVSERTVQRVLREAETAGLLQRVERLGHGCKYRLTPRHAVTPDKVSPVTNATETPDTVSPNTSGTVISGKAKASPQRAKRSDGFHPLPDDWRPTRPLSPNCQAKVAQWPPGAFEDELESFQAWAANADPVKGKGLKKDWDDAFANWIRSQHSRYQRQQQHRPNLGKTSAALLALGGVRDELPM